jgi:thioester reductase-like protein
VTTQHSVKNNELPRPARRAPRPVDLQSEAVLDPTLDFSTVHREPCGETAAARAIFLTGATGFLGTFLLADLLRQTEATVYCLVRGADEQHAFGRIHSKLVGNALWDESYRQRIVAVPGDLGQPLFGLDPQTFDELAGQLDVIYHNGSNVNFRYPYSALKGPNVVGTQEIIRLAIARKCKPLHYISTVYVFEPRRETDSQVRYEDEPLGDGSRLLLGYTQSKWVAEQIIAQARERGLPVFVYRPGVLIGDSETGIWDNVDDFFCRVIKGCIQLGAWPPLESTLALTPVNYVSKAIVHLAQNGTGQSNFFHLVNPHLVSIRQLFEWIESLGYPLQRLPLAEWQAKLKQESTRPQDNALGLLLPILVKQLATGDEETLPDLFAQERFPHFDDRNTRAGLAGSAIVCPPLSREHMRGYLAYFVQSGFLEPSTVPVQD